MVLEQSVRRTLGAYAQESVDVSMPLPPDLLDRAADNELWLAALLQPAPDAGPTALSQRTLHVYRPIEGDLRDRTVYLDARSEELETFLREQGARIVLPPAEPPPGAVLLHPQSPESPTDRAAAGVLLSRVRGGARAVFLRAQASPPEIEELAGVYAPDHGTDYLFAAQDTGLPDVRDPNGLTPALRFAIRERPDTDRVLLYGYPDSSGKPVAAVVERRLGEGSLVLCQVETSGRLSREAPYCDPACRHLLLRLLRPDGRP